jgi:hypothetical protein
MSVPAVLLAIQFILENQFRKEANRFLGDHFENKGYTLVFKKLEYYSKPKKIDLAFVQKRFTFSEMDSLQQILNRNYLANTKLNIRQNAFQFTDEERKKLIKDLDKDAEKTKLFQGMMQQQEANSRPSQPDAKILLQELSTLHPEITSVKLNETDSSFVRDSLFGYGKSLQTVEIGFSPGKPKMNADDKKKLEAWLRLRLNDSLILVRFIPRQGSVY